MRSILIIFVLVLSFFHSNTVLGQAPQPVRITNFGTYTGDQVKVLRGELEKEFDATRAVIATGDSQVGAKLTTVSDQLEQTNRLLQQQYDDRWRWWEIALMGIGLMGLLSLMLSILADHYLLRLQQSGNGPVTPPVTPPTSQEEEGEAVGDYANDHSVIINGGDINAPITVVFGNMAMTYHPPSQNRSSDGIDKIIKKTSENLYNALSDESPATGEK